MDKDQELQQPARRRLLKGLGMLGGAAAVGAGCPFHAGAAEQPDSFAPGTVTPNARQQRQPFYGVHQAGIITPQQAAMMLVAFDVLTSDRRELQRLFQLLTQRIAFLTAGGKA
ncbi:peroxidase, partial [Pantoea stewartii]